MQVQSGALYKLHYAMTSVASEFHCRTVAKYMAFPWVLCRLCDPRCTSEDHAAVVSALMRANNCCLDFGFSARLKRFLQEGGHDGTSLLMGGEHHGIIQILSAHKVMNIEVEDNFSRAARYRSTTQGQPGNGPLLPLRLNYKWLVCWNLCVLRPIRSQ